MVEPALIAFFLVDVDVFIPAAGTLQSRRVRLHLLSHRRRRVHHQDRPAQGGRVLAEAAAGLLHEPQPEPAHAPAEVLRLVLLPVQQQERPADSDEQLVAVVHQAPPEVRLEGLDVQAKGEQVRAAEEVADVQGSRLHGDASEWHQPRGGHVHRAHQDHPAGLPRAGVVQDHGLLAARRHPQHGPGAEGEAGGAREEPAEGVARRRLRHGGCAGGGPGDGRRAGRRRRAQPHQVSPSVFLNFFDSSIKPLRIRFYYVQCPSQIDKSPAFSCAFHGYGEHPS